MIRGVKFKSLLESTQREAAQAKPIAGRRGLFVQDPVTRTVRPVMTFRESFRRELGLSNSVHGLRLDPATRTVNPRDISLQEVAWEFLGRDFADSLEEAFHNGRQYQAIAERQEERGLTESAGGAVVLPSHFGNVNAFVSSVAGLLDALVLEAYQSPEFIGDSMVTMDYTKVNGGKLIGARGEGGEASHKEPGEAAPMNGLKELFITVPDVKNFREALAINADTFIYDRTGQLQDAADFIGLKVGRAKELDIADMVMGLTALSSDNRHTQDGKTADIYLTVRNDKPNNYVNSDANTLSDFSDINHAQMVLANNKDPYTNYEIQISRPFKILTSPEREMTARQVINATQTRLATQSGNLQTYSPAPELAIAEVVSSWIWYNRQISAVGTSTSDINWFMGNFQKAFNYRVIEPFNIKDDPTEVSVRRDVLMCRVAALKGKAYSKNPRYVYRGVVG